MGNGAPLRISVTTGTGEAPTELAAFDRALLDAGIANHNLLPLSSMIPPGAEVREKEAPEADTWGQVLYVVLAQQRESRVGVEAWAGLGWVQDEDTGRGMFVEHEGGNRRSVEAQIEASLYSMIASRAMSFGPIQTAIAGSTCHILPVCAVVVAVYGAPHPWDNGPDI
ncbi:MAG: arginine decarboxylase [Acidimicrobiaceae bacterium]|jgi:arginine decarboxylase|nr:arginine decarboxylase [Acidimicrobiaceae bacterium]